MNQEIFFSVISSGRSKNVPKIRKLFSISTWGDVRWFVGKGEREAYEKEGACNVQETPSLPSARNCSLRAAFQMNLPCLQMSDDIAYIRMLNSESKCTGSITDATRLAKQVGYTDLTVETAAEALLEALRGTGAKLGGVYPVKNFGMALMTGPVSKGLFCIGDFFLTLPSTPLFDRRLPLKEDYDFTCKHLSQYGQVVRLNYMIVGASHYSNPGGAVARRSAALEEKCVQILLKKWPQFIRRNPRREGEVLLKYRASQ